MKLAAYTIVYTSLATLGLVVLRRTLADASIAAVLREPGLYAGGALYATSFGTFLASLRHFEVLTVFPLFTGVTYATVTLAAGLLLSEELTAARVAGIGLVATGVLLLIR